FYELIVAARGTVDDDFAWFVFDIGATWPHQDASPGLPEVRLSGEDLFLDNKRIRFRRRFVTKGSRLMRVPMRARPKEKRQGDWKKIGFGRGICSYPPEDVLVESFGNHLRKKALRV